MEQFGDFNTTSSPAGTFDGFSATPQQDEVNDAFGSFVPQPTKPSNTTDDDYTEEELQRMAQAEASEQVRKAELFEKTQREEQAKRERKSAAEVALKEWQTQRDGQIKLRRTNNAEQEK